MAVANPSVADTSELKRRYWLPSGAIDETIDQRLGGTDAGLVSGTLRLAGGMVVPAGVTVSSITFRSGSTAAVTPTAQWFCLVRQSDLSVLAKSVDDTTAAWAATTPKTLALSATFTPTVDTPVYAGVVVVAATPPNMQGITQGASGIAPIYTGTSTTGLTNPASLGATAAALTASTLAFYAYIA